MTSMKRPSLGVRAVSDVTPLVEVQADAAKGEVARGSHAMCAGARVASGKQTVLGGIAPLSPFLPLPSAPTMDELQRKTAASGGIRSQRRPSSHDGVDEHAGQMAKMKVFVPAPSMIRSYSTPVATQNDFENQMQASRLLRQQRASKLGSSMSRNDSYIGEKVSPPLLGRSPLRALQSMELNSPPKEMEPISPTSSSSSGEATTPRANDESTTYFSTADTCQTSPYADFFIHPSHFQAPSAWKPLR